jgi:nucleotide-binding universal stress UspA family protein
MTGYRSIVVGTDGSATAALAVRREEQVGAEEALGEEACLVRGSTPAEETLAVAADAAKQAGAREIRTQPVDGAPVDVLRKAVADHAADLLVVGNRGLNTLSGRVLGSVPSHVARTAGCDVLIVHTSD